MISEGTGPRDHKGIAAATEDGRGGIEGGGGGGEVGGNGQEPKTWDIQ